MQDACHGEDWSSRAWNKASEDQHDHAAVFHRVLRFEEAAWAHHAEELFAVDESCAEGSAHENPKRVADDESEVCSGEYIFPLESAVIDKRASGNQEEIFRDMEADAADDERPKDEPRSVAGDPFVPRSRLGWGELRCVSQSSRHGGSCRVDRLCEERVKLEDGELE